MPPHVTTVAATRMCETLRGLLDPDRGRPGLRVHGVYRSALNLADGDSTLITIAFEAVGGLPHGILVHGEDVGDFRALGIEPGMTVTMDGRSITLGSALRVDLSGARPWSAMLPRLDIEPWPRRALFIHHLASAQRQPAGLDAVPGARGALDALGSAIASGDGSGVVDAADRLIGLGPGLTPSGDDALAGVEAALHVTGHPLAGAVSDALDDLDRRTTVVSAAMLRHAVRGEAPERIHRLMAAILDPTTDRHGLTKGIRDTVAWGATSGSDTLAGVLVGLDGATAAVDRWQAA